MKLACRKCGRVVTGVSRWAAIPLCDPDWATKWATDPDVCTARMEFVEFEPADEAALMDKCNDDRTEGYRERKYDDMLRRHEPGGLDDPLSHDKWRELRRSRI